MQQSLGLLLTERTAAICGPAPVRVVEDEVISSMQATEGEQMGSVGLIGRDGRMRERCFHQARQTAGSSTPRRLA
jgi:hypothetical protein